MGTAIIKTLGVREGPPAHWPEWAGGAPYPPSLEAYRKEVEITFPDDDELCPECGQLRPAQLSS